MKVRFVGSQESERALTPALEFLHTFEAAGEYVLSEVRCERLAIAADGETVYVDAEEIFEIESFGHDIYIYTFCETHVTHTPMYELEALLPPARFLRVSRSSIGTLSAIVRRGAYRAGRGFLRLSNGREFVVTRSYYPKFREVFKK